MPSFIEAQNGKKDPLIEKAFVKKWYKIVYLWVMFFILGVDSSLVYEEESL